jgi:hypothetical protein
VPTSHKRRAKNFANPARTTVEQTDRDSENGLKGDSENARRVSRNPSKKLVVQGVSSELVSARIPCYAGKIQGNSPI